MILILIFFERMVGDKGYCVDENVSTNNRYNTLDVNKFKKIARAGHEALMDV